MRAILLALGAATLVGVGAVRAYVNQVGPTGIPRVARSPWLRTQPIFLYPAQGLAAPPRAYIFFLGNDVGFWTAHRALSWRLSLEGYAIAGLDIRPILDSLPQSRAEREQAFRARTTRLLATARHELGADSTPVLIAGHSLGAELAIVLASEAIPRLVGVVAMSPGGRSHLEISPSDVLTSSDPTGPESFAISEALRRIPEPVRVAIVRGSGDGLRRVDDSLLASYRPPVRRFIVMLAGHSLKSVALSGPVVDGAIDWLLSPEGDRHHR
ncbi:MAG: hypothetical protein ABIT38_11580 [Gemmatimonadaceae bacterium]